MSTASAAHASPPSSATGRKPGVPYPFDMALPASPPPGPYLRRRPLSQVIADWTAQIARERLAEVTLNYRQLRMRDGDGAICRVLDGVAGQGYATTPHGWSQFVALLTALSPRPANLANCLRWLLNPLRAGVVNANVIERSKRSEADLIVLRTRVVTEQGHEIRLIRATTSTRHSGTYLDDSALCPVLAATLPANSLATFQRGDDKTTGYAVLGNSGPHLQRTLHWRNSETGCASLSFSAGAIIRFVDSVVRFPGAHEIDREKVVDAASIILARAQGSSRMRHTTPGGKAADEETRASVAAARMQTNIRKVMDASDEVHGRWMDALESFAPDWKPVAAGDRAFAFEVLADAIEEHGGGFEGDDRAALLKILTDDTRLEQLPWGSAAHVCAAFAVMGERAVSSEETERLQAVAGRWMLTGWGR